MTGACRIDPTTPRRGKTCTWQNAAGGADSCPARGGVVTQSSGTVSPRG